MDERGTVAVTNLLPFKNLFALFVVVVVVVVVVNNEADAVDKTKTLLLSTTVVFVDAKSRCPPSIIDEEWHRAAILLKLISIILL